MIYRLLSKFLLPLPISTISLGIFSYPASANQFHEINLHDCPLAAPLRLSSSNAAGKFQSLEGCTQRIAHRVETAPVLLSPVMRIVGVTEEQIREMEEDRAEYEQEKAKSSSISHSAPDPQPYDREIRQAASQYNIDPLFLHAIVATESAYRPDAVSHAGARGLMQIMPGTGADLGVERAELFDPVRNIDAGARHLKALQRRFGGNLELVLGAYNAGAGAVARYRNRIPPFAETRGYVGKVMGRYRTLLSYGGSIR